MRLWFFKSYTAGVTVVFCGLSIRLGRTIWQCLFAISSESHMMRLQRVPTSTSGCTNLASRSRRDAATMFAMPRRSELGRQKVASMWWEKGEGRKEKGEEEQTARAAR